MSPIALGAHYTDAQLSKGPRRSLSFSESFVFTTDGVHDKGNQRECVGEGIGTIYSERKSYAP